MHIRNRIYIDIFKKLFAKSCKQGIVFVSFIQLASPATLVNELVLFVVCVESFNHTADAGKGPVSALVPFPRTADNLYIRVQCTGAHVNM